MTNPTTSRMTLVPTLDPQWVAGRGRLAQSIRLEEQGPARLNVVAITVIAVALTIFVLWASITQLGEIASASGEVTPVGSVKKIQHLEGGIVATINVHEGDLVEAGQVLMTLDQGAAAPELEQQRTRLAALELEEAQLRAVTGGGAHVAAKDNRFGGLAATQDELLLSKRRELDAQEEVLRRQVQEQRAGLDLAAAQAKTVREQVAILGEQIQARQGLVEEGYMARTLLLDQQRELARTKTQLAELEGQMLRARATIAGSEARIAELHTRTRLDATQEISKVRGDIAELHEVIARAQDRVKRLVVRSPVRGIVKGLQTETVGGVVAPGSTLLEVIPVDAPLIVEARVLPRDIGYVHVDQPVLVKVATYDYTRFGGIEGRIETVSATTFQDDKGNPFYRARIRLAKNYVGDDAQRMRVIPGMTVLADIRTGEKSVLAYLFKPLARASGEALRER